MDKITRGLIEHALDGVLEIDILDLVTWIREEASTKSPEDLALGYVLGSAMRLARQVVWTEKLEKKQRVRTEKELGKERAEQFWAGLEKAGKEVKPIRVYLSKKDEDEIKDMLRRRIPDYRRKIYREKFK